MSTVPLPCRPSSVGSRATSSLDPTVGITDGSAPSGSASRTPSRRASQSAAALRSARGARAGGEPGELPAAARASARTAGVSSTGVPMDRSTTPSGGAAARARAPASASQGKSGSCRERASWALVRGRPSVLVALRRQRRDQRVVLADLAGLRRAARTAEVGEELDVGVVEVLPLVRDVVLVVDGLHRADRLAGAAVHALVGVDVEHPVALVDAVHRTLVDARLVEDVDAGLGDAVGHGGSLPGSARATTLAGPGPIVRGQYDGRLPAQREGSRCGAGGSPPEGGGRRGELHAAALPADGSDVSDAPVRRVRT